MAADASEREDVPEATVRIIEFRLGGERFAVGVGVVDSIVEFDDPTRVPRTPDAIHGVIDLRGEITAIIDPRAFLDVDPEVEPVDQRVLVLDESMDKQRIGLRVDEVIGVQEYPEDAVQSPDVIDELGTPRVKQRTIRSIVRRPHESDDLELFAWLDVEELVDLCRQHVRDAEQS